MAGQKVTADYMQSIIDANMQLVPKDTLESKWAGWDQKKRYTMILTYIRKLDKTPSRVKKVLVEIDKKKLNYEEIGILIEKLNEKKHLLAAPMIAEYEKVIAEANEKLAQLKKQ